MRFDLNTKKWTSVADMKAARSFSNSCFFYEGFVYAIGGNEQNLCERFDVDNGMWEVIPSYTEVCNYKELNNWTLAIV